MSVIDKFKNESKDAVEIDITFPESVNHINNQLLPSKNHDGLFYVLLEKK